MSNQMLNLVDIGYAIGGYPLFQNLTASFAPGCLHGLKGCNGTGKSTLVRILSGLLKPEQGHVLYLKQDIYKNPFAIKSKLGFVPATPMLYPHLTIIENFKLIKKLRQLNTPNVLPLPLILDQCELMGYQKVLFGKLSDGLKKRAGIAANLIHQPQVLILDEPCSALDPNQRAQLWHLLKQLIQPQRIILFSSHHTKEMHAIVDKVWVLAQGKLC